MNCNIKDFGADGNAATLNTVRIQNAIDTCAAGGGGRVVIEDGVFMTGTLIMRSNVDLHISANAVLLGSPDCKDYPERDDVKHVSSSLLPRNRNACLIFAEECENVSISGMGTIDCNGTSFIREKAEYTGGWKYERIDASTPPRVVFFTGCRNVRITDITMTNQPAGWSYWIHDCDFVTMDRLKILAEVQYPNNDGIHINSSRDVTVSNCSIVTGDDSIIVRANNVSLAEDKVCERVTVTNCSLTSYANGIRIGWINDGTIRNCVFSNIVMTDTNCGITIQLPSHGETDIWSDEGREATLVENLSFSNIVMDSIYASPLRILIGDSEKVTKCRGIRNICFDSIRARGLEFPIFMGRKNNHIENLTLNNCRFEKVGDEVYPDYEKHGAAQWDRPRDNRLFYFVKDTVMNNTVFSSETD